MAGLPLLPGLTFRDPTLTRFNRSQTFEIRNGYAIPKLDYTGVGQRILTQDSTKYFTKTDCTRFDSAMIYGRCKVPPPPLFKPHWVIFDKKCLCFTGFFKEGIYESPNEYYRIRQIKLIYFLEDDTMLVSEPKTRDSGMDQGVLVARGRIPKNTSGNCYHWKDLAVGKNIAINGVVYHLVDCDSFTREYMASQGLIMADPEQMPPDPYTQARTMKESFSKESPSNDDKLRRFLEYDSKILLFNALWDDRDSEYGEMLKCEIRYFLATDEISIKLILGENSGRDPCPTLLKRTKVPKLWKDVPSTFWSIIFERSDKEVSEYYAPKDFKVGETLFIYSRKFFLYDCDKFTRQYYIKALDIEQQPAIKIEEKATPKFEPPMPPYSGFGSLEDSLQSTKSFLLKEVKKDLVKQLLNANNLLSYECVLENIHPEDKTRKFIMQYNLGTSTMRIYEPPIKNSGFISGKFLRFTEVSKPGTDPLNPELYTPADFYVGALINVFGWRFKIIDLDTKVYRYIQANPCKFRPEVIENIRNHLYNQGKLEEDLLQQIDDMDFGEKKRERDNIGRELEVIKTELQKCEEETGLPAPELTHKGVLIPQPGVPERQTFNYEIKPLTGICSYPPNVEAKARECKTEEEILKASEFDTPEQKLKKYYDNILRQQKIICQEEDVKRGAAAHP